ncbi:MAG: GNAT family N-acetyltransferase [Ginsengibacter sp.]
MHVIDDIQLTKIMKKDSRLHLLLVRDERVMKYITGRSMTAKEAEEKFKNILYSNTLDPELGYFKITNNQTGNFIGVAKMEIKENESSEAEIGYLILPEYWGKGIVGKVAHYLMELAKTKKQIKKVFAIIDPYNIPSRKILERFEFISKGLLDYNGLPGEYLELDIRSGN